jgi:hypothetical protein
MMTRKLDKAAIFAGQYFGALLLALSAIQSAGAQADSSARVEQSASRTMLRVGRATGAIKLDGASASVWSVADSISDFRQREPREGGPASEHVASARRLIPVR